VVAPAPRREAAERELPAGHAADSIGKATIDRVHRLPGGRRSVDCGYVLLTLPSWRSSGNPRCPGGFLLISNSDRGQPTARHLSPDPRTRSLRMRLRRLSSEFCLDANSGLATYPARFVAPVTTRKVGRERQGEPAPGHTRKQIPITPPISLSISGI
jgi:hypothetical protein